MSGIFGETLAFGQERGPDIELVVHGDEYYARYETRDGYAVVYDGDRGLFCYARVVDGRYESTGVPAASAPPPGIERHSKESDAVRRAKVAERVAARSRTPPAAGS
jgi:hypothetical protein